MYESPINLYMQEIMSKMENERENAITAKISESIGVDIDKGELIKALQYDRQQYSKGYADAKAMCESMLDEIRAEIEEQIERDFVFAKTEEVKVPVHYGTANGLQVAARIIDKYRKGDEE